MSKTIEILTGLDIDELEAIADGKLASSSQARLDELLARNSNQQLSDEETEEIDQLLVKIDQWTILKARAIYTLQQQTEAKQR